MDKLPPAGRLGLITPARDEQPQTPFAEGVDFERGGRPHEAGLDLSGQLQKVHNLIPGISIKRAPFGLDPNTPWL